MPDAYSLMSDACSRMSDANSLHQEACSRMSGKDAEIQSIKKALFRFSGRGLFD